MACVFCSFEGFENLLRLIHKSSGARRRKFTETCFPYY